MAETLDDVTEFPTMVLINWSEPRREARWSCRRVPQV